MSKKKNEWQWRFVSAGTIMRTFAASLRMSIEDFASYNRAHPEEGYDVRCDAEMTDYGCQNFTTLDGRLSQIAAPRGMHVRLGCAVEVRAARRQTDPKYSHLSVDEIAELIKQRDVDDDVRFAELYKGSVWPDEDYDLVLDTGKINPAESLAAILAAHENWQTEHKEQGNLKYSIAGN